MQTNLFDPIAPTVEPCKFAGSSVSHATRYAYGCRCELCKADKAAKKKEAANRVLCTERGCGATAQQESGRCRKHKVCPVEGCTATRKQAQGAKYCPDHQSVAGRTPIPCLMCGVMVKTSSKANVNTLCVDHKQFHRACRQLRRHGASEDQIRAMIADPTCWICREPVRVDDWGRKAGSNRHVDHDHKCCPTGEGCSRCIRGWAHARCNTGLGIVEQMLDTLGRDGFERLLDELRP